MKYLKPLRLHFYGLRKTYAFFFFFVLLLTMTLKVLEVNNRMILYLTLLLSMLLSLFTGVYEYKVISNSYLSLKINRKNFFVSSIIFGVVHSILFTLLLLLVVTMLSVYAKDTTIVYNKTNLAYYLYGGVYFLFFFLLGNFASLHLKRLHFFKTILATLLLIFLILYGTTAFQMGYNGLSTLLDNPHEYLYLLKANILVLPLLAVINYIKFCIRY